MVNAEKKRQAREDRAAQLRAEARRREARRRTAVVSGVVLAVLALVITVFVVVQQAKRGDQTASATSPSNIGPSNSIVVGDSSAPVTLVAYEDFQCPVCKQFEDENASQLDAWVKAGTLKIEYRPIAFLDRESTTRYSTRALDAAAAVVNSDPSAFPAFHRLLFANQPAEGSAGLTDAKLASLAAQAGASQSLIAGALSKGTYEAWAAKVTDDSSKAGVTGTPTLIVNGKQLPDFSAGTVKAAVEAAAK
jgi:protein-disulfide isomerase